MFLLCLLGLVVVSQRRKWTFDDAEANIVLANDGRIERVEVEQ